jgi:protein-disulfide isomerase/cyclophilin family peptidyl-prolyl cis-trans isomerase
MFRKGIPMRKYMVVFLLLAILFTAACSKTGVADATQVASETAGDSEAAEATVAPFTSADESCKPYNLIDDLLLQPVDANVPAVTDADFIEGPADAKYTITVYSNFTCSHCANLEPILAQLQTLFSNTVRIVFRYVTTGGNSNVAAQAVEAANIQGKFQEMKNVLFENQATWYSYSEDDFRDWLGEQAASFGMDVDQFDTDIDSETTLNKVTENRTGVDELGIYGTPTIYVNNRQYTQTRSVATFAIMLDVMDISDQLLGDCPIISTDFTKDLQAVISTSKGDIVVDLYEDEAPNTVAYFQYLAEKGWYNNNNIIISTAEYSISGDPSNTLYGGPGFAYFNELATDQTLNEEGLLVSFNQLGTGYNTGIFMLTKSAVTDFTGEISIFGKVIEGMDVLNAFTDRPYSLDPAEPFYDSITSITIFEK